MYVCHTNQIGAIIKIKNQIQIVSYKLYRLYVRLEIQVMVFEDG